MQGWEKIRDYHEHYAGDIVEHIVHELNSLRYELIQTRKRLGVDRELIASIMGVDITKIEDFESCEGDPRLSEILWYASTIGVDITITTCLHDSLVHNIIE